MGHGHGHGPVTASGRHRGRLVLVLVITGVILAVQVVGALVSGSLALLADAGHVLTDTAGVALALVAITLAARPAAGRRTFGLARAEILAAAVNAAVLLAVGGFVLYEAVERLAEPTEVATGPMLVFGVIGLVGNAVSLAVLMGARDDGLNMRGAFLEVATDTLGSVGVIAAALVAALTGFTRADAVVALLIGLLILPRAVKLLREAVDVLLQAAPKDVDLDHVRAHIAGVDGVQGSHDLHVWTLTSGMPVLSAHVVVDEKSFQDGRAPRLLDALQECLAEHFDVEHCTFQLEPPGHARHELPTHA
ncbi:cation diffusion facilitator family transporter [Spirillospora sp. NPDC050679]